VQYGQGFLFAQPQPFLPAAEEEEAQATKLAG
jgi:EAL domain-containing protein (putative c-di-GMP-specific phosphodiesterase class I)